MPGREKRIYLSFDDGPTEQLTNWILDMLEKYNAKATFFCVGENAEKHPALFQELVSRGHTVGNHTHHHLNGLKTDTAVYGEDILEADHFIGSKLFRPPYGRMKPSQIKLINELDYKTVMWSVLTYDFDKDLDIPVAWEQIKKHTKPGSILVFHDNVKAVKNIIELLTKTLDYFAGQGYTFEAIV